MGILGIILNCIGWWGASSVDLEGQTDLRINYSYSIGPRAKKKKTQKNKTNKKDSSVYYNNALEHEKTTLQK